MRAFQEYRFQITPVFDPARADANQPPKGGSLSGSAGFSLPLTMNAASASFQPRNFDKWVFGIGMLATLIGLLSDFLEGYTGIFLSWLFPVLLLVLGLYFAFIPAAIVLLARAVLPRGVGAPVRIQLLIGAGLVVVLGCFGLRQDRLRLTMDGFLAQLKRRTTATAFQTAALQILDGKTNTQGFVPFVSEFHDTNLIPMFATNIFWGEPPRVVYLSPPGDGLPAHYTMEWGGHFIGLFGITAGADNYKPDGRIAEEWIQWKPGVYVCWRFN
jgi:hypothetical protein